MKTKYWIAIITGALLTPLAHESATAQRGYFAIGGEILIIPLLFMGVMIASQIKERIEETNRVFREREERAKCTKQKAQSKRPKARAGAKDQKSKY